MCIPVVQFDRRKVCAFLYSYCTWCLLFILANVVQGGAGDQFMKEKFMSSLRLFSDFLLGLWNNFMK